MCIKKIVEFNEIFLPFLESHLLLNGSPKYFFNNGNSNIPTQLWWKLIITFSSRSEWKIYLETLPQSYDVPYFDCPQDLLIYLPRHLKVSIEEQFRLIDTQFRELVKVLQEENFVSKKIFAWAWFTVNTRGVYFPGQ